MSIRIALAGNPNCGKTTMFNDLTGSSQYVGNWPGVTVEKKEGRLKGKKDVVITDLPGIYSLSPYTLEEVVSRNYLMNEHPDAIINLVDGTNLERNLYLTTQILELGISVVPVSYTHLIQLFHPSSPPSLRPAYPAAAVSYTPLITLGPNLCCPSQLQFIPNQGEPESVELPYPATGMQFEVLRVQECLAQGLLECPDFTWEESLKICGVIDQLRREWGIRYASDR